MRIHDPARTTRLILVLEATTGGTRRHIELLLEGLIGKHFEITLVYSLERADHRFRQVLDNFRKLDIKTIEIPMCRDLTPFKDLRAALRLSAVIRRTKPHIIHLHSSKAGLIGRLGAVVAGQMHKVVYSPHGFAFQRHPHRVVDHCSALAERVLARMTDSFLFVSESEYLHASRNSVVVPGRSHYKVLYNEAPPCRPRCNRAKWRRHWGIEEHQFVFGCVANFRTQKGHRYLIDAFASVAKRDSDTLLVLVGTGPKLRSCRDQATRLGLLERILFVGEGKCVDSWLGAMDAFVLPSLWEGFSYSLLEAMGAGLPVIATSVDGNSEAVSHQHNGLLVDPADARPLALTMLRILQDSQLRQRLTRQALKTAASRSTLDQWASDYSDYYDQVGKINARSGRFRAHEVRDVVTNRRL